MPVTGKTMFETKTWDEQTTQELEDGRKMTRVRASFSYQGDLEGLGSVEYLMAYAPDGTGMFSGLEYIEGKIAGHQGSFVVRHVGTFDPRSVNTHWEFIPGLGMQALEGLTGGGEITLAGHGPYPITFTFDLPGKTGA